MALTDVNLNDLAVAKVDPSLAQASAKQAKANALGRDDFLRMLVAQLEHQDPLNPQDGTEFTAQLAQFSSLEQLITIRENLDKVVQSQRELASAIQGMASSALIGREAVVATDQMELDADGQLRVGPAFDLASASSETRLSVRAASGHALGEVELGPLARGFHRVPADAIEKLGLAPGRYRFEVEAHSGGDAVAAELQAVGAITSSTPGGDTPSVQIGGIRVPYSQLRSLQESSAPRAATAPAASAERRERASEAAARPNRDVAPEPASDEPANAAPAAREPLAASAPRRHLNAGAGEPSIAEAPKDRPARASAAPRGESIADRVEPARTGRPVFNSGATAGTRSASARPPAVA